MYLKFNLSFKLNNQRSFLNEKALLECNSNNAFSFNVFIFSLPDIFNILSRVSMTSVYKVSISSFL